MHAQRWSIVAGGSNARGAVDAIALHATDDRDRIRKIRMIGASTVDQEASTFQPLDNDGAMHDAGKRRVCRFGRPCPYQPAERLEAGISCHVMTSARTSGFWYLDLRLATLGNDFLIAWTDTSRLVAWPECGTGSTRNQDGRRS